MNDAQMYLRSLALAVRQTRVFIADRRRAPDAFTVIPLPAHKEAGATSTFQLDIEAETFLHRALATTLNDPELLCIGEERPVSDDAVFAAVWHGWLLCSIPPLPFPPPDGELSSPPHAENPMPNRAMKRTLRNIISPSSFCVPLILSFSPQGRREFGVFLLPQVNHISWRLSSIKKSPRLIGCANLTRGGFDYSHLPVLV